MASSSYTAEIFQDAGSAWRWRLRERNGQIVATSGEGYVNESHARQMTKQLFPDATTVTHLEEKPGVAPGPLRHEEDGSES